MGERSRSSEVWQLHRENSLDWVAAFLGVVLAGIHLYVGITEGEFQFLVAGAVFLLGVLSFLTAYWRPILYTLGAMYALALGLIWLLNGMQYQTIGVVTGAISTVFVALVLYLFVTEDPTFSGA